MSAELSAAIGFVVGAVMVLLATPIATRIANRTGFYDLPREYRQHKQPTPFLGGAAVVFGVIVAAAALGVDWKLMVVVGCAFGLWALGTLDDRFAVRPKWRLLAETGAATALVAAGLGWDTHVSATADAALTIVWVLGIVNAFNLMDNLDGACGTVAGVASAGIGVLAAIKGQPQIAGLAFALSGACASFLLWNLARPARIFLGDGGSMPIGFLVAALAMATASHSYTGRAGVLVGALLVGLPILDTALVSLSRPRRGISLWTGGRDHLTHRSLLALRTPRAVAAALALGQGGLCALAILGYQLGAGAVFAFAALAIAVGGTLILVLDTARWRPAGIAVRPTPVTGEPAEATSSSVDPRLSTGIEVS